MNQSEFLARTLGAIVILPKKNRHGYFASMSEVFKLATLSMPSTQ